MKYFTVTFNDGEKMGVPMSLIEKLYPAILDCNDDEERKIFIQEIVHWHRVRSSAVKMGFVTNNYAEQFANNPCEMIERD